MKAVFVVFNQALTEQVEQAFSSLAIHGYSQWPEMHGAGSMKGEPHLGTHIWPTLNTGMLTIVEDNVVPKLLSKIQKIDKSAERQGMHAFVWNIEAMV